MVRVGVPRDQPTTPETHAERRGLEHNHNLKKASLTPLGLVAGHGRVPGVKGGLRAPGHEPSLKTCRASQVTSPGYEPSQDVTSPGYELFLVTSPLKTSEPGHEPYLQTFGATERSEIVLRSRVCNRFVAKRAIFLRAAPCIAIKTKLENRQEVI